jgi:hypothetical protein
MRENNKGIRKQTEGKKEADGTDKQVRALRKAAFLVNERSDASECRPGTDT